MKRLTLEEREALEAIPDEEYAKLQVKWAKRELKYWKKQLKKARSENND